MFQVSGTNIPAMKFKFLSGDVNYSDYGGSFVSKKLSNGEFDYWLVMEVLNWEHACPGDGCPKYNVSLNVVAPSQCPEKERQSAIRSMGMSDEDLGEFMSAVGDTAMVEILNEYGIKATVWNANGNNLRKLMQEARRQATGVEHLFGFYMDQPENAIGADGWDFIKGNPLGYLLREEA